MNDLFTTAAEQAVQLSRGTGCDLSRIVLKDTGDSTQVTMLLRDLQGYAALMGDPAKKDMLMSLFFQTLRRSGCELPEEPRFSFRFTVDL